MNCCGLWMMVGRHGLIRLIIQEVCHKCGTNLREKGFRDLNVSWRSWLSLTLRSPGTLLSNYSGGVICHGVNPHNILEEDYI